MDEQFSVKPIGHIRCARSEPFDDGWDALPASIALDPMQFGEDALAGLDSFSHVEIVYVFHKVAEVAINLGARHPRGRQDWPKIGIFAQRGKDRPNRIGATICNVIAVEGRTLQVRGLDAIDGSPVLDIKPVLSGFQPRGAFHEPPWARELMQGYW